ncbi:hypothetical protein ACFFKU_06825 [Kineococcus gynurae]|uniref:Uncharacterized protein n=1 Tax=Kineococcus gynurae TaxID=452979 RepID=A0ABV5LWY9_9ACTN
MTDETPDEQGRRRLALIRDGLVENVVLADADYDPPTGLQAVDLDDDSLVGPGWSHRGRDRFEAPRVSPSLPVPDPVSALSTRASTSEARIDALAAAVSGLLLAQQLPDADDDVLNDLDALTGTAGPGASPGAGDDLDLDDILAQLTGA